MKTKFIILGSGSSVGVPRVDGYWGNCKKNNKKNFRTRCSAILINKSNNILIDTSPDLRQQMISNNIKKINTVLFTHEHADQTHGVNDLRPFFWSNKKKIDIYGSNNTVRYLKNNFTYLFKKTLGYAPTLKAHIINKKFSLSLDNSKINFDIIKVKHGKIYSYGYIFKKLAYISDCNGIDDFNLRKLANLNYLVIDCLKFKKHHTHFNLKEALKVIERVKPKKAFLTNLGTDLDYNYLLNILPINVKPAYDGLKIYL